MEQKCYVSNLSQDLLDISYLIYNLIPHSIKVYLSWIVC